VRIPLPSDERPAPKSYDGARPRASRRAQERRQRERRKLLIRGAAAAVVVVAIGAVIATAPPAAVPINTTLSQHVTIQIFMNGSNVVIPAHIGINATRWIDHSLDAFSINSTQAAIHTHNTTGSVHVQLKKWHPCTLGDFFSIWGASFNSEHLLSYTGTVTVTVNGKPNGDFRGLVLQEGQVIVIRAG
jgi:protein-S-isoprenylcysteine O-methyltransferase Ste14